MKSLKPVKYYSVKMESMSKRHPTKPTDSTLFCFSTTADKHHKLALSLEAKGAWRRAARQWLDLSMKTMNVNTGHASRKMFNDR
ncbi:PerC family transcriptional regulator [Salmonella enterica subsp. enterica serovar Newport]